MTKRWLPERFAELSDRIVAEGFFPILIGSPSERHISESVRQFAKSGIMDLTGETSVPELAALMTRSVCVVSNDTGPMHLAGALRIPVVSIFGPTDPYRCGAWLDETPAVQARVDLLEMLQEKLLASHMHEEYIGFGGSGKDFFLYRLGR